MINIKQLSEKLAEEYAPMNPNNGHESALEQTAFIKGFQSCLDLLAKQSGEHEKDRCPCGGVILADTEDFPVPVCNECFEPYEKLQQKVAKLEKEINLKDLQIKSLAASDTLKKADLLIAELQQRVKELEALVGTIRGLTGCEVRNVKDISVEQHSVEIMAKFQEAVGVIEFYADKENWNKSNCTYRATISNDFEPLDHRGYKKPFGGKRARSFLTKLKGGW